MSTIEEAREQAREALELVHTWRQREQAWDTPRALGFEKIGQAIRTLLDATEPPAQAEPAEDEREDIARIIDRHVAMPVSSRLRIARSLQGNGYRKGPRPITDEMVEAAADAIRWASEHGGWAKMARAALEAAEEARR